VSFGSGWLNHVARESMKLGAEGEVTHIPAADRRERLLVRGALRKAWAA